ncbi:glycosyltransferase 87 family protein [Micromonospora sonneratiae]|uniref:Glycosyltransferase family 87 protein n=1 Tax=Micromonospora sonneratiae TaxID=1184706 RepID=A0ABW3YJM7_9ACTN
MAQGAPWRTSHRVIFVIALVVAVTGFLAIAAVGHAFFDLKVYYGALNYWHDGGSIYDFLKPGTKYGFTYPPFAALVMLPMAYVPWPLAIVISVALSVVTSALLLWWLVEPIARRVGWNHWFALAVALCLAAAFEPMRETVDFGQVNMLLLFLVGADLLRLVGQGSRWAGVGIGLATAIKLTPGVFILYLLVTGRWRAAFTAMGTAVAATLFAGAVAPDASRTFWTEALWNTDRVGALDFISNQSLRGVVARLNPSDPSTAAWLALVVLTLAVWVWRSRAAAAAGDEAAGLALTGALSCLISPVTWVHHLVWLLPALVLLVDNAYLAPAGSRRRRWLLGSAIVAYGFLISRIVWVWERDFSGVLGFVGGNLYVWISLALLVALPIRCRSQVAGSTQSGGQPRSGASGGEAGQLAEPGDVAQLGKPYRRPSPRPLKFENHSFAVGH